MERSNRELDKENGSLGGSLKLPPRAGDRSGERNTDSRRAGTYRTDGTGGTGGTAEKEKTQPKLVPVNIPGEPKGELPEVKKPRKKRQSKSTGTVDKKQLSGLLMGVSSVIASRPNCEAMILAPDEAEKIAEPLADLIAKSEALKSLADHGDAVALIAACVMILTPKIVVTATKIKKENPKKGGKAKNVEYRGNAETADKNRRGNSAGTPDTGPKHSRGILDGMPSIA